MPPIDPTGIARRIREARLQAGLTQAEMAEAAGVTDETISRIERGAFEPAISTFFALAQALGLSLDELAGGTQRKSRSTKNRVGVSPLALRLAEQALELDSAALSALLRISELLAKRTSMDATKQRVSAMSQLEYSAEQREIGLPTAASRPLAYGDREAEGRSPRKRRTKT